MNAEYSPNGCYVLEGKGQKIRCIEADTGKVSLRCRCLG